MSTIDQTEDSPQSIMPQKEFEEKKYHLQIELLKWQYHVREHKTQHMIVFEGKDAAGKGGTIKRFMEHMNPKFARVVALDKPTDQERSQWYWQRYVKEFPKQGEIVFWDRSWYNRATVESVMGFASQDQVEQFYYQCPLMENMLVSSGINLIKFWLVVSKEEQTRRFTERQNHPLKLGKLSPIDIASQSLWNEYEEAEVNIMKNMKSLVPWVKVNSNCKRSARIACMQYVLLNHDYVNKDEKNIGKIDESVVSIQQSG